MPFKTKYIVIIATILVALITLKIIHINSKFDNITTINREMNIPFEYKDMTITVTEAEWIDENQFYIEYGNYDYLVSDYKESFKDDEWKLLRITLNVQDVTREQYSNLLQWYIVYETTGNGTTHYTDLVNEVTNDTPENKEIYLFYRINPDQYKNSENIKYFVRTDLYPSQNIIHLEVNE